MKQNQYDQPEVFGQLEDVAFGQRAGRCGGMARLPHLAS